MTKIELIKALSDNYIACIINLSNDRCAIVDPGDADPVLKFLDERRLKLSAILITHHHWDHTHGVEKLKSLFNIPVYGYTNEPVPGLTHPLSDHDKITLDDIGLSLNIMHIPGHTLGHIAYYNDQIIFSGDTLFTGGCGKIFESSVDQLYNSLMRIATLNQDTLIYCGHEYTAENLKFALKVEPNNIDLQNRIETVNRLHKNNLPTVPALLSLETLTNPFLRCSVSTVKRAAENHINRNLSTPQEVLRVLREWKNQ